MLKKCKECGMDVSDQAECCVHCGFKLTRKKNNRGSGCLWLLVLVMFFTVMMVFIGHQSRNDVPVEVADHVIDRDAEVKLKGFVENLIRTEVLYKVENPYGVPHVYVGRAFGVVGIDEKNQALNVVFVYYKNLDAKVNFMQIYDGYSGGKIGSFSASGFEME